MGNCIRICYPPTYHSDPPRSQFLRRVEGRYHCGCGSILEESSVSGHLKTMKHRNYVQSQHAVPAVKISSYPQHIIELIVQRDTQCSICFEDLTMDNIYVTLCGHSMCQKCSTQLNKCPICRTTM